MPMTLSALAMTTMVNNLILGGYYVHDFADYSEYEKNDTGDISSDSENKIGYSVGAAAVLSKKFVVGIRLQKYEVFDAGGHLIGLNVGYKF